MPVMKKILIVTISLALSGPVLAQSFGDLLKKLPGTGNAVFDNAKNLVEKTQPMDESREIALGQEFAASLLGAKPLLNDPAAQRYVNTLGRWLASQTERPDLPWAFGVLDDETGFNAFATPGGNIFITKGLLLRMRNEAELAGVLSHEIAHVLRKHYVKAVQTSGGLGVVGDVVASKWNANGQVKEILGKLFKDIYTKGLDKDDEYEADRVGVVIAARGGFDAYGLPGVLQTLQTQSAADNNFSLLFETHPTPADRLSRLDKAMGSQFDSMGWKPSMSIAERLKEFGR